MITAREVEAMAGLANMVFREIRDTLWIKAYPDSGKMWDIIESLTPQGQQTRVTQLTQEDHDRRCRGQDSRV